MTDRRTTEAASWHKLIGLQPDELMKAMIGDADDAWEQWSSTLLNRFVFHVLLKLKDQKALQWLDAEANQTHKKKLITAGSQQKDTPP